jgi:DNA-binding HxlR family transcriptional regulator
VSLGAPVVPLRSTPVPGGRSTEGARTPIEAALDAVGDRQRLLIVWHLFWGPRPFCDLMRNIAGITKKALRHTLAEMESRGLVRRDVRFGSGRKADYSLTPFGETLKPIVGSLYEWGLHFESCCDHGRPFHRRGTEERLTLSPIRRTERT